MPHSPEFNQRRREQYRLGRLAGLTPRDAGHIYAEKERSVKVAVALSKPTSTTPKMVPSPLVRQQDYARTTSSGRTNPAHYLPHSDYGAYVNVRIDARDDEGKVSKKFVTVAFKEATVPTREQVMNRVSEYVERNAGRYETAVLIGYTILGTELVSDRTPAGHTSTQVRLDAAL